MARIKAIAAREIIDSRGVPTLEAIVECEGDIRGYAMVPAGISKGTYEAVELRDRDESRYFGKGVLQAVKNIHTEISSALVNFDTGNQLKIDHRLIELDGTEKKSRLGANAILAVSLACVRAESEAQHIPLYELIAQLAQKKSFVMPVPQINLINGGKHASNGLSIQEFHILPVGAKDFATALRIGVEIHHALRAILSDAGFQTEVGDEGGFAPKLVKSEDAFAFIVRAIEQANYVPGVDVCLGIDAAASEFYEPDKAGYLVDGSILHASDVAFLYKSWKERYPLISIEDPFSEDSWDEWKAFTASNGTYTQIVGDDLYATNPARIRQGIQQGATNAVLIKPNQIGTFSETLEAITIAQEAGQNVIISHRSGETEDSFIADLAVAVGAGQIKTGAPSRSDRTSKYNRLLRIEDESHAPIAHSMQRFYEHESARYMHSMHGGVEFTPDRVRS
ncbi:MAG TPA: phosphopyruvate hydratase [Candidatus Andersenbacteria bacterium]|nr:phosphopyruvate hydratase [Candidatus Andersenbacteria bacterium]